MNNSQRKDIPEKILEAILRQAEQEYPHECCGMIMGPEKEPEQLTRLCPCRNVYDHYHQLDPVNFPRTAKTAYFIDPKELLAIQKENYRLGEEIRMIYHSHIDAGSYFSEEDTRVALAEGEPAYPGARYLVVSVMQGKVKDTSIYHWDSSRKVFST